MPPQKFCIDKRGQIIDHKTGKVVGHAYLTCDISPNTAKMHPLPKEPDDA